VDQTGAITMPAGRYLSITIDVHPDYGGQTRALLMRNRIFAAHGANADVLSVSEAPDMDWRRETLRERGLLSDDIDLLNIYEHYRDTDWPGEEATDEELPDLGAQVVKEQTRPDGSPWRRRYRLTDGQRVHDYLRPDGSTFIRVPSFIYHEPETWPSEITKVSRDGRVVGRYKSPAGWFRRWVRDMAGDERTFVFLDSRFMVPLLAPMKVPNIHLIYQMHNMHLLGERRWDSHQGPAYTRVMGLLDDFDGFVTLTQRQQEDIAQLRGRTSNMYVVSNPVDLPPEPPVVERDPRLVTVVARIEGQKRLGHAVEAFQHVVAEVPDARLEIYGDGSRRDIIQRIIDRLGLNGSVTMKGHDPHARQVLWRSSAFLMTSNYEGYPLSTLESLSHGCPVVSYDIKYGPREQITDGVDGFLVPPGNRRAAAERVVQLLRDPDLVRRMSAAAREKAAAHGYQRFLTEWGEVLRGVVEDKPRRTRIKDASLEVRRLTVGRRTLGPARVGAGKRVHLDADLKVVGRGDLSRADVTLSAVHEGSGLVVDLPVSVRRRGDTFRLRASAPVTDLYPADAAAQDRCRLRVRLTWANSSWETQVQRPESAPGGLEVGFGLDDEWTLTRR
jgi:poly(glycerol-phosphate) alpha-glucosyltransferase